MLCRLSVLMCLLLGTARADDKGLEDRLRALTDKDLATTEDVARGFPQMLGRDARARIEAANRGSSEAWAQVRTKDDWERFLRPRLQALRESLGTIPPPPERPVVKLTGNLKGDGYVIEKLAFESRPGLWVSANLYAPEKPGKAMPGILLCHSHHNPKTEGELQDMGVTWARQGCVVLVMDQLGHGERRQHPFVDAKSYPKTFRVGRQDYYFRYNTALQLYLVGDSLMGWMSRDLSRGVDLLLARAGVDKGKIVLLGAVAGGGDPAAVAAALDPRIAAVAPFNFGGPQPETVYPLPADAATSFNYAGGGSWESTRNLRLSARDGFLPWVIVGAVAPRRLIHAHEFAWDRERDPVWKRLQQIYQLHNVAENLSFTHGRGRLSGRPPEATHCNNIGPEHRVAIHGALQKWFDLPVPQKESRDRRPAAELACLTPEIKTRPMWELAGEVGEGRARAFRQALEKESDRPARLRREWTRLLGAVEPRAKAKVVAEHAQDLGGATLQRVLLEVEPGIHVPLLVLRPEGAKGRLPVVVGVAQAGKAEFLRRRANALAELLREKAIVCLADVRGTGETRAGSGRGRQTSATSIAATELMLGQTLVGSQLRDLRSVLAYLRTRDDVDGKRLQVWGESFAPANPKFDAELGVPLDADPQPKLAEPGAALLATLVGLFEDHLSGACGSGGLASYASLLRGPFVHVPFDAVVPGAVAAGDLPALVREQQGRLFIDRTVDGLNLPVSEDRPREVLAWIKGKLRAD